MQSAFLFGRDFDTQLDSSTERSQLTESRRWTVQRMSHHAVCLACEQTPSSFNTWSSGLVFNPLVAASAQKRVRCQTAALIALHAGLQGVKIQTHFNMSSPESVEKAFDAVWRLILEDFDAAFHLWKRTRLLALRSQLGDSKSDATVLTSILDDFAKAPTGWTQS